ncbi:MAG TPA: GNAT family N-acetyltransferase [Thermoplasmata archaeon]|nr:GNAT family N-acetyltransferase [Thermoplasmata archaeon]
MELRRIDPNQDEDHVRAFLSASDPDDYLLEGLEEWIHEGRLWAGVVDEEWVAFGRLHDLGGGDGWLSGLRVLASRRREGFGSALLNGLLSDAEAMRLRTTRAVIEDENIASRGLFARQGFQETVELALRRGETRSGPGPFLRRAARGDRLDGPLDWIAGEAGLVDLLPGSDGGRFGRWRPSLVDAWIEEGMLYVGPGLAAVVQMDWWTEPRTLWVDPLRGGAARLFPAVSSLTRELDHDEWQAFLPSGERDRAEYDRLGLTRHSFWGDRVHLFERELFQSRSAAAGTRGGAEPRQEPSAGSSARSGTRRSRTDGR